MRITAHWSMGERMKRLAMTAIGGGALAVGLLTVAGGVAAVDMLTVPTPPSVQTERGGAHPYSFISTIPAQGGGEAPTRWIACDGLTLLVARNGMPANGKEAVRQAAAEISELTGVPVTVQYADTVPAAAAENTIFLQWKATPSKTNKLEGCDDAEAIACTETVTAGFGSGQHIYGANITVYDDELDSGVLHSTLLHELGHAFGLNHVDSHSELMYPEIAGQAHLGKGDRDALRIAGQFTCPRR